MIKNLLQKTLTEAQEKGQSGLLIWASWRVWDKFAFNMKKEELINNLCNKAKEDTKQLNDFFATNI